MVQMSPSILPDQEFLMPSRTCGIHKRPVEEKYPRPLEEHFAEGARLLTPAREELGRIAHAK